MTRYTQSHRMARVAMMLLMLLPAMAGAQAPDTLLAYKFPELVRHFNAFEVVHASVFEEVVLTNASPQAAIGKDLLRTSLRELALKRGSHYHTAGDHLAMLGPYRVFESRVTPGMLSMIQQGYTDKEAKHAFANSGTLPDDVLAIFQRGRAFQLRMLEICLDSETLNKRAAIDDAVAAYLSDERYSLPSQPKSSDLLSKHPYAYAFRVGFPQLSGLTWASTWLNLAALEIIVTGADEDWMVDAGVERALALYVDKVSRQHGTMAQLPTDIPTVPVVAPNLYSAHREAANIIDNLTAFHIVVADVLAHPDVADRQAALADVVAKYTDRENFLESEMDYLTFVLRGGIFNQGGPALGGMSQSERNRSRDALENPHVNINRLQLSN
ncbi:MAG: hypothetical protein Q7L07_06470 [Pseudohongiella sp.]|nr:hypothetical protein [Pseudohongiella sp.]